MRHGYRGYGLSLASEIELPEYLPTPVPENPDILVHLDDGVQDLWRKSAGVSNAFIPVSEGGYLLRIDDVAIYHVRGGNEIRIAAETGADAGLVRLFTIGSAMGMALHQRGFLVLHGATIELYGQARILVGDSGAGKSTLAARLGQAGCTVLGDDTMALWNAPGGGAGKWLWQGSRVFKLWGDSVRAMGIGFDGLTALGNRTDKYFVPNTALEATRRDATDIGVELAEILVLETEAGPARIEPLSGIRALQAVAVNTYRPEYIVLLGREAEHFRQCGALTREVPVSRLVRPWGVSAFDETVELVLSRWDWRQVAQSSCQ